MINALSLAYLGIVVAVLRILCISTVDAAAQVVIVKGFYQGFIV